MSSCCTPMYCKLVRKYYNRGMAKKNAMASEFHLVCLALDFGPKGKVVKKKEKNQKKNPDVSGELTWFG